MIKIHSCLALKHNQALFEDTFQYARDIPYKVVLNRSAVTVRGIVNDIKKRHEGSCTSKHYLLGKKLEKMGMGVHYTTFPFLWYEQPIELPTTIKKMAKKMPVQYHLCLEIDQSNERSLVDATWDNRLQKHGFHVNLCDNLNTPMVNAVMPSCEPIRHGSAEERQSYIQGLRNKQTLDFNYVKEFYSLLNVWLEGLRTSDDCDIN